MGLDMYAFTTTEKPPALADFEISQSERLHYWRKHPDLHGWMEALYREKHGSAESFNCVNLALTADDLDRLEADIRKAGCLTRKAFSSATPTGRSWKTIWRL